MGERYGTLGALCAICLSLSRSSPLGRERRLRKSYQRRQPEYTAFVQSVCSPFSHRLCTCDVLCSALFTPYPVPLTKRKNLIEINPHTRRDDHVTATSINSC